MTGHKQFRQRNTCDTAGLVIGSEVIYIGKIGKFIG